MDRYKNTKNAAQPGFSLVELIVVIGTVALLLSILVPALGKARSMAKQVACAHNLKQISIAVNLYLDGNDDTYPCNEKDPQPTGHWLWMGRGWRSFLQPYLGLDIDANNPSVLFCPQDRTAAEIYESTSYAYSMAFYHSPDQINDMNDISCTWSNPQPSIPQKRFSVTDPAGKILIAEWLSNHSRIKGEDGGWWCWKGQRNYLFADGHVHYLKAQDIRKANDGFPDGNLTKNGIKGTDWPKLINDN